jgi:hypothetical protein
VDETRCQGGGIAIYDAFLLLSDEVLLRLTPAQLTLSGYQSEGGNRVENSRLGYGNFPHWDVKIPTLAEGTKNTADLGIGCDGGNQR